MTYANKFGVEDINVIASGQTLGAMLKMSPAGSGVTQIEVKGIDSIATSDIFKDIQTIHDILRNQQRGHPLVLTDDISNLSFYCIPMSFSVGMTAKLPLIIEYTLVLKGASNSTTLNDLSPKKELAGAVTRSLVNTIGGKK